MGTKVTRQVEQNRRKGEKENGRFRESVHHKSELRIAVISVQCADSNKVRYKWVSCLMRYDDWSREFILYKD